VRLGILGGTFNPPHLAHLICAQEAYLQLELDRVLLIPTRVPPHKQVDEEPGAEHRLQLCRMAVLGDERFAVSDLEVVRGGLSYTVDTLEKLHLQAPDNDLFFILGGDAAAELPSWQEPERVLSLATLAVARRRGTPQDRVQQALGQLPGGEQSRFFKMPRIGISSTLIRTRVRSGRPIRYMVPEAVATYINQHELYGGPART
jgi:nicotinate-nucleotide adenylyltransferase